MPAFLRGPYGPGLATAILVAFLPLVLDSNFTLRLATVVYIYAIAVLGLNLLMGYAGQVSLGHAGFFALGAYAVAVGPAALGIPAWLALPAGIGLTAVLAAVIGRPILRFRGYHLAVATLAFGIIVSIVLGNEVNWTGGPDGMAVQRLSVGGWRASGVSTWYWIAGTTLAVIMLAIGSLLTSPTGRALQAVHYSEVAAATLGIDVARHKLFAFVLSAVLAALAGAYLALFDGHVTPAVGGVTRSVEFLTMAVLGGLGSIWGSIVGAAILILLPQVLTSMHDYEHAMLGGLIMLTMMFMRRGIVPTLVGRFTGPAA